MSIAKAFLVPRIFQEIFFQVYPISIQHSHHLDIVLSQTNIIFEKNIDYLNITGIFKYIWKAF